MNKSNGRDASSGVSKRFKSQRSGRVMFGSLQARIGMFAISSCVALILGAAVVFILVQNASDASHRKH